MITPNQAKKHSRQDSNELKRLEEKIDETIVNDFQKGAKSAMIPYEIFRDEEARKTIVGRYRTKGWAVSKVEHPGDQREGTSTEYYLRFSPKKRVYSQGYDWD